MDGMMHYDPKPTPWQKVRGYVLSGLYAWQMTGKRHDQWSRYSWWLVHRRHHWWLKLLGREQNKPTEHAPWLNAEAIAYRRAIGRKEPFLG
jgi:hypothetical protein